MSESLEICVGVIGRAHGIRGEVSIDLRTDEPDRRFGVGAVLRFEDSPRTVTIASTRDHSGRFVVRFAELPDRTAVESVRGTRLVVDIDPAEMPDEPEEFYDRQLVGLRALDAHGTLIGEVTTVVHLPAQDLLEIRTASGPRLVPFVEAIVPIVDLAAGEVRLADVPGLLSDLDDADDHETPAGDAQGPDATGTQD